MVWTFVRQARTSFTRSFRSYTHRLWYATSYYPRQRFVTLEPILVKDCISLTNTIQTINFKYWNMKVLLKWHHKALLQYTVYSCVQYTVYSSVFYNIRSIFIIYAISCFCNAIYRVMIIRTKCKLHVLIFHKQNRETTEGCSNRIVRKKLQHVREKDWFQQVENMQVPNGTGPGVRRSKHPLSACYSRRKCSMETSHNWIRPILYSS